MSPSGAFWTTGIANVGLGIDTGHLDLASAAGLIEGRDEGSISLWARSLTSHVSYYPLLTLTDATTLEDWMYVSIGDSTGWLDDESLTFVLTRADTLRLVMHVRLGQGHYLDGDWHHIVVSTGDGSNAVYVDGASVPVTYLTGSAATAEFSDLDGYDTFLLGSRDLGFQSQFMGTLDDVRIYDRALQEHEAEALYQQTPHDAPCTPSTTSPSTSATSTTSSNTSPTTSTPSTTTTSSTTSGTDTSSDTSSTTTSTTSTDSGEPTDPPTVPRQRRQCPVLLEGQDMVPLVPGESLSYEVQLARSGNQPFHWTGAGLLGWPGVWFDAGTARIQWLPPGNGTYQGSVELVSDGCGQTFRLTVEVGPEQESPEGQEESERTTLLGGSARSPTVQTRALDPHVPKSLDPLEQAPAEVPSVHAPVDEARGGIWGWVVTVVVAAFLLVGLFALRRRLE